MTDRTEPASGLTRTIGPLGLASSVINAIIGSSIFVFPAVVATGLGAAGISAYLVAAFAMSLVVLSFVESGSRVTGSGGAYAYVAKAFGPFAGWVVGFLLYAGVQLIASAVVASVFVRSLSVLWAPAGTGVARIGLIVSIYLVLAIINIRGGAKGGARLVQSVTIAKLLPLLILVGVGLFAFRPEFVRWDGLPAAGDLGRMAMRLLYLFAGTEAVLSVSGELRDPGRTVPRGALGGLAVATMIYLGVQFAAQGLLGPELASHDKAPLADAAAVALGEGGRTLILLGAVISTIGYLSADILVSPRSLFAMAEAGRLPRAVARVDRRFGSPAIAIAVHATLAAALAVQADFDTLTSLASSALLVIYLVGCSAALVLRRRGVGEATALKLPGGPLIPIAAIVLVLALFTTLTRREVVAVLIAIGVAGVAYLISKRGAASA